MIVRSIDNNNDWLFGRSKQDYKRDRDAVAQRIKTRLQSFLGDCFFDLEAGIDWFNLLGSKEVVRLTLNIQAIILNTPNVIRLNQIDFDLSATRELNLQYEVLTIYGVVTQEDFLQVQTFVDQGFGNLITQGNGILATESSEDLVTESSEDIATESSNIVTQNTNNLVWQN